MDDDIITSIKQLFITNKVKIKSIKIDCKNLRIERQNQNNTNVLNSIYDKEIFKYANKKEIERVLSELDITLDQLLEKCNKNIYFAKLLSGRISIKASRQGILDESFVLDICNQTTSKIGIYIKKLSKNAFKPTKNGKIITNCMNKKYDKNECLKSFDGQISGKINGWIFAKIVYALGGHQDNVFEEAHQFCDWVKKFGNLNDFYILLIETDLHKQIKSLKLKISDISKNILCLCHFEFQEYLISRYYEDDN